MLLTATAAYGLVVWLLGGLATNHWWPQLVCWGATVYLMTELSNTNALLRIRSTMVSAVFILLSGTMTDCFASMQGAITQLCFVGFLLLLFNTYQDKLSMGRTFYAFVCLGLGSMAAVETLWLVPVAWLLMTTQLQSMSWRNWMASVFGLLLPYWLLMLWFVYLQDFTPLADHLSMLIELEIPYDYTQTDWMRWLFFGFLAVLTVTGIVHCRHNSYEDKIRIRLLLGFFAVMALTCMVLTALQPYLYDPMMRFAVICASPLIAHFLTLTSSRITNIVFFTSMGICIAITALNLWMR